MNKKREIKVQVEAPEETKIISFIAPKRNFDTDFITLFQDFLLTVPTNKNLNWTDLRLLLTMLGFLDYKNEINITQSELAKHISVKRPEVTKSIKKLIEENCITLARTEGRKNIYKLNPYLGLKDKGRKHKKMCREWDENPQEY